MSMNADTIVKVMKESRQGLYLLTGEALHAGPTLPHVGEGSGEKHVFLLDEIDKNAPTLIGKSLNRDHDPTKILPYPNKVTKSWCNKIIQALCFEAQITPDVASWFREGQIKGVSVELNWAIKGGSIHYVNGFAAKDFEFIGLALLHELMPADPKAYARLAEAIFTPRPHTPDEPKEPPEPENREPKTLDQHVRRLLVWK